MSTARTLINGAIKQLFTVQDVLVELEGGGVRPPKPWRRVKDDWSHEIDLIAVIIDSLEEALDEL